MLLIGPNGAPAGNFVRRSRSWDFSDSTTPAWITPVLDGASTTSHGTDSIGGHLLISPAGTSAAQVTAPQVDSTRMKMMRIVFHFLPTTPEQTYEMAFRLFASGAADGVSWGRHLPGFTNTTFRRLKVGSGNVHLRSRMPQLIGGAFYDLSLWFDFTDGMAYVGRGDTPWDEFDCSPILDAMKVGSVIPSLRIKASAGTPPTLKLYRFSVEWWT